MAVLISRPCQLPLLNQRFRRGLLGENLKWQCLESPPPPNNCQVKPPAQHIVKMLYGSTIWGGFPLNPKLGTS